MIGFLYVAIQPPALAVPPRTDMTLANLKLWKPGSEVIAAQTLHISDGIIHKIEPSKADEVNAICNGCFAMPGLIDAHVHTPPTIAFGNRELFSLLYLQYGVTSVRDLGQFDDDLPYLKNRLNQGRLVGPRMYHCGRILDGDPLSV